MAQTTKQLTVLVEAPEIIYRAIEELLDRGMQSVGQSEGAGESLESVKRLKPQLLVKATPGKVSPEEISEIKKASPKTGVAVLSDNPSPQKAREVLKAGALTYLGLQEDCETIKEGLRAAARGEAYMPPGIAAELIREETMGSPGRLTAREQEVLKETALGYTSTQIGERLYMSKRTVESHRANINYKLGFSNRAMLVEYAIKSQIIP